MKYITEAALRAALRAEAPACYQVPQGQRLTPAAREYLQSRKIRIVPPGSTKPGAKFVDAETGAAYSEKPEHMTHLNGNVLAPKSHPRIAFRGRLDSLQSTILLVQCALDGHGYDRLLADLEDLLRALRMMMRCDVLDEELPGGSLIGLSHPQLREQSHDPQRFFGVRAMTLPHYTMGRELAMLNRLRTAVRETELAAVEAFLEDGRCTRSDLVEELNRMSSALHIMMCRWIAGQYRT